MDSLELSNHTIMDSLELSNHTMDSLELSNHMEQTNDTNGRLLDWINP
jgi:hypothetical protein